MASAKEIGKLIDNIDAKIKYYRDLRTYATKEIARYLDVKKDLIDSYDQSEA